MDHALVENQTFAISNPMADAAGVNKNDHKSPWQIFDMGFAMKRP